MSQLWTITRREFAGYFSTPLAFVFIVVFLLANGLATFYLGAYFAVGQADLTSFFMFHPWLYLFFLPAISMRLWAEERRNGSIELLLTLPVPLSAIVVGKYLAALGFSTLALMLTFPVWLTVNFICVQFAHSASIGRELCWLALKMCNCKLTTKFFLLTWPRLRHMRFGIIWWLEQNEMVIIAP